MLYKHQKLQIEQYKEQIWVQPGPNQSLQVDQVILFFFIYIMQFQNQLTDIHFLTAKQSLYNFQRKNA